MKKKLFYVLPEFDPETPTHYAHILELLEKLGEEFDIFLFVEKAKLPPKIKNINQVYAQKFNLAGLNIIEKTIVIIWARIKGYTTAYVHYSYWSAILSSLILRLTGGIVLYWHCEVYENFFSVFRWTRASITKKLFDEYALVLTLKAISYLVTGTKTVGEFYSKTFDLSPEKIKIIPNWINPKKFQLKETKKQLRELLNLPQNKKIIIFAHRLSPRKGADFLPELISSVTKGDPAAWFFIAGGGGGDLKNWLEQELMRRNLTSYVHVSPGIPNVDLPQYLLASDVFIMPSRQEGFPRVLLEAMAAGLPFVATDVGGTRDILNSNQLNYLVPPKNPKIFSDALTRLLSSSKERSLLSQTGKEQVAKYSLDKVVRTFINTVFS